MKKHKQNKNQLNYIDLELHVQLYWQLDFMSSTYLYTQFEAYLQDQLHDQLSHQIYLQLEELTYGL